jgi:hypothetical protein
MSTRKPNIPAANAQLRGYLEGLFGDGLPGVAGYGAGLDHTTRSPALNVMTTTKSATSRARSNLPTEIEGLPVKVTRRGPAILE